MTVDANYREWRFERTLGLLEPGPWQDEPDKIQWIDAATGLDCLIKRNGGGALCGYVGVTEGHPWHGKEYDQCVADSCDDTDCWNYAHIPGRVDVHDGLTYSAPCADGDPERGICHIPAPGRPDSVWWFGFDCAHGGDLSPKFPPLFSGDTYKTVPYVRAECERLAQQLAAVSA